MICVKKFFFIISKKRKHLINIVIFIKLLKKFIFKNFLLNFKYY